MIAENRRTRAHTDWFLIVMVMLIALFGILAVSVATYSTSSESDVPLLNHIVNSSFALRQSLFVLVAPIILSLIMSIPYEMLRRSSKILYYLSNLLLLVVWVFNRATGVKAWLDTLWGFTIQPSEFAKLSMILVLARVLSQSDKPMSTMQDFVRIMVMMAIPALIIVASGEMGSLLVIIFFFAIMLYFSGVDIRLLLFMASVVVLGVLALYGYMVASGSDNYRLIRILAFLNPEAYSSSGSYQQTQSKIAIGSGGLSGIGMFINGSMSQLNYVPADWTDFVFSTIGEAWGFIGCVSLLAAYFIIILRMLYLAYYTRDKFGSLIIIGVMAMLLFHVFENVGMTIGLLPITGIPLPFVSYGGSNMVTNMGGVALVLNVTKNRSLAPSIPTPQVRTSIRRFQRGPLGG